MADAALLHRLESVVAQLERVAGKLGGASGASGHGAHAEEKVVPPQVLAYDDLTDRVYKPFYETCKRLDGLHAIGDQANTALSHLRKVIDASLQCKKPSDSDLMKFLEPTANSVNAAQNCDNRSAFFNHQKAFSEAVQLVNWVVLPGPAAHVRGTLEAAEFYLNKVLTIAKDAQDPDKEIHRAFVSGLKNIVNETAQYVQDNFKMGLIWNVKGGDLKSYGGSSAAPAAPPLAAGGSAPPPPPPLLDTTPVSSAPKPAAAGMAAVFGELSKGESVTAGLKKVTAEMKSKNMKDVPTLEPKRAAPVVVAPVAAKAKEVKPPSLERRQGTWFVEYYVNDAEIQDVDMKENIYVLKARNCTINVPAKCKSITLDGCFKTRVIFTQVVSSVDVVNCDSVSLIITENCPNLSVDKSSGIQIYLNETSVQTPPNIITSNATELNLIVPGAKPEDDPIELPLPHQFLTVFKNGKVITEPVSHSGA